MKRHSNHPPGFFVYVDDFSSDGKVEAMTTEEVGAYWLLLLKAWKEDPPGSVPNDDRILSRWARLTPEKWSECKAGVLSAFQPPNSSNRMVQKRMTVEYAKVMRFREQQRINIKSRWNKKLDTTVIPSNQNGINSVIPNAYLPSPIPSPSPIPNKKKELTCSFDRFWSAYPRKDSKQDALRAWISLKPENGLTEMIVENVRSRALSEDWTKDNGKFCPLPATYLRKRRWEDEGTKVQPSSSPGYHQKWEKPDWMKVEEEKTTEVDHVEDQD
jgi:uncharacterized protein YdaU (DUF1376 family)